MDYLLLTALLCVLDCAYFKFKYTVPRGPPVWCGLPFIGLTPLILLPKSIYIPFLRWFFRKAPDVLITRHVTVFVLVKGSRIKDLQLDDSILGRASTPATSLISYITTGKPGWTIFDNGDPHLDWRTSRKNNLRAIYNLPKRQLFSKISDVVDSFLATINKHENQLWDFRDDLFFNKVQESGYISLGKTLETNHIQNFMEAARKRLDKAILLTLIGYLVPFKIFVMLAEMISGLLWKPSIMGNCFKNTISKIIKAIPETLEEAKDFAGAASMRIKDPEDLLVFLREVALFNVVATTLTTQHSISMALAQLAFNPEHQQRAFREIDSVAGASPLTIDHLAQLQYLKAVIHETFRISPPVTYVLRRTVRTTRVGDYVIPPNLTILMIVLSEAWDEKHYKDPLTFQPNRFLSKEGVFCNDDHVSVFSRGKRSCVGQDMGVLSASLYLAKILQHFEVQLGPDNTKFNLHDGGILAPPIGIPLKFVRRSGAPDIKPKALDTGLTAIINDVIEEELSRNSKAL